MKTYIANTERDSILIEYRVLDYSKEFAEQHIYEISGEYLSVREGK